MPTKKVSYIALALLAFLLTANAEDQLLSSQDSNDQLDSDPILATTTFGRTTRQDVFPVSGAEIYGFILVMLFAGLANSGGLGGGTLLTPLLIIVFNYSESNAIQMVYALVFGGSVGNFINLVRKRDPQTGKPLIEYDLGLVCMPLMLLGATIGVILNRIFAPLVTLIGLMAVIVYSLTRMYTKAMKQYADESKQRKKEAALVEMSEATEVKNNVPVETVTSINHPDQVAGLDPHLDAVLKEDRRLFPIRKVAVAGFLIVALIVLALLRGTSKLSSIVGVPYCEGGYWGLIAVTIVICIIALFINIRLLRGPMRIKKLHNFRAPPGKFEFSQEHMIPLIMLSLIAGVLAGLLGIGGGMIMAPTLISIGVPSQGLAATSGFFIVQTSFISLVQSCLYRDLPLGDQGFFMLLSVIGSFGVSYALNRLVAKYKRPSIILFTLMFVLTLSLIATPTFEILTNVKHFGEMLSFNPVC